MSRIWQFETVRVLVGGLIFLAFVLLCEYVGTSANTALRMAFLVILSIAAAVTVWYLSLDR